MKIGIITFHKSVNYGAILQAYALSTYLKNNGHEVYFIDYDRKLGGSKSLFSIYYFQLALRMLIRNPLKIFVSLFGKLSNKKSKVFYRKDPIKVRSLIMCFSGFKEKYLKLTESSYGSPDDLKRNPPKMDAYITGSDQVWGYGKTTFSDAYFLNFGDKKILRISYAPSFGRPTIEKGLNKDLSRLLKKFDAVSVREKSGVEIIGKVSNVKVTHVVDPTLLLDDYSQITDKIESKPYLLVFRLNQSEELKSKFTLLTKSIESLLHVESKIIAPMESLQDEKNELNVSVEGFLGYIASSKFVLTNSFHGTVFAIINKVNFICCARTDQNEGQNDRMLGLLDELGLLDRYCDFESDKDCKSFIDNPINWENVSERLNVLRKTSYDFLSDALNNTQN
jgi:hypothetical protein